jgi:hypothetical protein
MKKTGAGKGSLRAGKKKLTTVSLVLPLLNGSILNALGWPCFIA